MDDAQTEDLDHARSLLVAAIREMLVAVGEDINREGLQSTPTRVADSLIGFFSGVTLDPAMPLGTVFAAQSHDRITIRNIPVASFCEHHLLPFTGLADIEYTPDKHVAGLSDFAKTIEILSGRPQIQENLTAQIAEVIDGAIAPLEVTVTLTCVHTCMTARGGSNHGTSVTTAATRGSRSRASG
jgi:GTP cyclohydrolase I